MDQDSGNAESKNGAGNDKSFLSFWGRNIAGKSADQHAGDDQSHNVDTDADKQIIADCIQLYDHFGDGPAAQM